MGDFELESIQSLLDMPQILSPQNILDEAINELTRLEEQAMLVLDDYHAITTSVIHEILEYFLEHQPSHVHLVLITRSDPPLPLARLHARGQLVEIRARDLPFTENEAWQFFKQSMQLDLKEDTVNALEMRTEGCAFGLQLAALAIQNLSASQKFIETFRGRHRYVLDYLAEEVIHQQEDDIRQFLVQTSVLKRFNAERICA